MAIQEVTKDMSVTTQLALSMSRTLYGESFAIKEGGFHYVIHPRDIEVVSGGYRVKTNAQVIHKDAVI